MSSGGDGKKAAPGAPLGELDPRRTVYRRDLAAKSLYGKVSVPRYAQPVPAQVVRSAVPLRDQPSLSRGFLTEALYGELVDVYEERDGWAWIQLKRDRYVGYVPADSLTQNIVEPTHRVRALGTFVYPSPDIKTPPVMHLSLNAQVRIVGANETFCALEAGGFVVARHVTETGRFARDFVEIAERFIGTPYLWGGRTRMGIDCSGLVQVSLEAAGMKAPRDTDMQQAELGSLQLTSHSSPPAIADLNGDRRPEIIAFQAGGGGLDGVCRDIAFPARRGYERSTIPFKTQRRC